MKQPNKEKGFREAFATARKEGKKTFAFGKKKYSTETATEKASKQTMEQNLESTHKAYSKAKASGFKSKSYGEQVNSYGDAYSAQRSAKYGKK